MALAAVDCEPSIQRAAPAVLDRVAERADACRLADDAMVEKLTPRQRPVEELDRAVDRRAFLVAGDEKAERSGKRPLGDEAQGGGHSGGDAAFHVARAAAPELAVGDLGRERIEPPAFNIAGRHDVGVAGEGEIGTPAPDTEHAGSGPRASPAPRTRSARPRIRPESGDRADKATPRRPPASPSDNG